ncbi:conserved hypothetical protein [Beggiatoa sp. PS]|nr:conserved hypothetical protein [Beggiatoa sp. PS]
MTPKFILAEKTLYVIELMTHIMKSAEQQRLQNIFQQLPPEQQQTLLAFAEFLHTRITEESLPPAKPILKPRPLNESVIAAIKRLSESYPMLKKAILLNDTSRLMTEHIMHGRDSVEIIDELEAIFSRHYQTLIENKE